MSDRPEIFHRRFLVGISDSDVSLKAIRYLADMAGEMDDVEIIMFHIIPEPPPRYIEEGHTSDEYYSGKEEKAVPLFDRAEEIFTGAGMEKTVIRRHIEKVLPGEIISKAILRLQKDLACGTVVLGKRGISKAEEFMFGSISNTVTRNSSGFAVWIVS